MPNYKIGKDDPQYIQDIGSGPWCKLCSKETEPGFWSIVESMFLERYKAQKSFQVNMLLKYLNKQDNFIKIRYPFAQSHLVHYFENHQGIPGDPSDISYQSQTMKYFINNSPRLKKLFFKELRMAELFCERLSHNNPPNQWHDITSSTTESNDFSRDNNDLFYAIGGYQYWGKGRVRFNEMPNIPKNRYSVNKYGFRYLRSRYQYHLIFEFVLFDRYNWNKDSRVNFFSPVTDNDMGMFHKLGLAREYNIWGHFTYPVVWDEGYSL